LYCDCLSGSHAELVEDMLNVQLCGSFRDEEKLGNLSVRKPLP
jgi:hypothetical protein